MAILCAVGCAFIVLAATVGQFGFSFRQSGALKSENLVDGALAANLAMVNSKIQSLGGLQAFLRAQAGSIGDTVYNPPINFNLNNASTFATAFGFPKATPPLAPVALGQSSFTFLYTATLYKVDITRHPPVPTLLVIGGSSPDHLADVAYLLVTVTATSTASSVPGIPAISQTQQTVISAKDDPRVYACRD